MSAATRGVLWMLGTLLSLTTMAVAARELSEDYNTFQLLLMRNIFGMLVIGIIMTRRGVGLARTGRHGLHIVRNLIHIVGTGAWFFGIAYLPLAEVFVIESSLPIWAVLLAIPFLGEALTRRRALAVGLGFIGILIILQPGIAIIDRVSLVVLVGAFAFAGANICTKLLTRTEGPMTILFWMFLVQLLASAGPAIPGMTLPTLEHLPFIILVGMTGMTAHYCTARSLSLAHAGLVIPLHYLRVPLVAWVGWMLYDEVVDPMLWVGAAVIFAGTLINSRGGETKAAPPPTPTPPPDSR